MSRESSDDISITRTIVAVLLLIFVFGGFEVEGRVYGFNCGNCGTCKLHWGDKP